MENNNLDKGVDIWRNTPLRYLGYANEVGEAFGPLYPRFVPLSYGIAFAYVGCDTIDKSIKMHSSTGSMQSTLKAGVDTLIWQTLASVLIPGQAIRLITLGTTKMFNSSFACKNFPASAIKYSPTICGLSAIPLIIEPIDHFVDSLMDNTFRKWLS
jgi:fission process protein 1